MGWEYRYLRRALDLPDDPVRDAFEGWCIDSWQDIGRTEWSVRFRPDAVQVDRFIHSVRVTRPLTLKARLLMLQGAMGHDGPLLPMDRGAWGRLLDGTRLAIVAYAGAEQGRGPVLKVYLGVQPWTADAHAAVASTFDLPRPPGSPGVMVAATLSLDGPPRPRLYCFYNRQERDDPEVGAWLEPHVGPMDRFEAHDRVGVAAKHDGEDTVYVSLDGPGPLRELAEEAARDVPLLAERMGRATYLGMPSRCLGDPASLERSVYVQID